MKFNYDEIAAEAAELLKEFGTQMILSGTSTDPVYDPVTGTTTDPGDALITPFNGVKITPTMEYTQSIADGSVQARDMLIYAEPEIPYPNLQDTITINTRGAVEVWQIVNVQEITPADTPVLYIIQVRP
jgi:hypothetical protein